VRDEIAAELRNERARKGASEAAAEGAAKLRGGGDWSAVAGEDKVEPAAMVSRNDANLPAPVRALAFALPVPGVPDASVGSATLDNGDAAIVRVTKVEDGATIETDESAAAQVSMLAQLLGRQAYEATLADMQRRADIERKASKARDEGG